MPDKMAKKLKYTGRGKARSTLYYHLVNMYAKGISREPQVCCKSFESIQKTTYLCKRETPRGLYSLCKDIENDPKITYSLCFSSKDFFLVSRDDNLQVQKYGLSIIEKSKFYTPLYTIPSSWNLSFVESLERFMNHPFQKGNIERINYRAPSWDELDWKIFHCVKTNIREKFTIVAERVGTSSVTVKKRFYGSIMPHCIQINYFFPQGFQSYIPIFLEIHSDYEKSIVTALRKFPCTSYVFPLSDALVVILHYDPLDSVVDIVKSFEKLEEKAIIDNFLLYYPIIYTK